jgi:hypothetical protein
VDGRDPGGPLSPAAAKGKTKTILLSHTIERRRASEKEYEEQEGRLASTGASRRCDDEALLAQKARVLGILALLSPT